MLTIIRKICRTYIGWFEIFSFFQQLYLISDDLVDNKLVQFCTLAISNTYTLILNDLMLLAIHKRGLNRSSKKTQH